VAATICLSRSQPAGLRTVAAGIRACRRAGLPSPAEKNARLVEDLPSSQVAIRLLPNSARLEAALYVRQDA
jgi:hypothetical protein